ncbi:hypothetical protein [Shewanella maritima]|uniref:hypothetical protein n=1 Tax=Shewanella maritima TaxID=2520507 RepID=UPI0037354F76
MNEYSPFFSDAYWWLSLIGGIHCVGVGIYIRYIYQSHNRSHKLLAAIFVLIGIYFFTGLITKETSPVPIHLVLTLFVPIYLLLMPLLYLYCKNSLTGQSKNNYWKHFAPALISAFTVSTAVLLRVGFDPHIHLEPINSLKQLSHINVLAIIFPLLLIAQALVYFSLLFSMFSQYRKRFSVLDQTTIKDIRFRWLVLLTVGILFNWITRLALVAIPFYVGDYFTTLNQAIARLSMLITVYVFAFYGLTQITRMAYLRGNLASDSNSPVKASAQLLNAEEMQYLQGVIKDDEKST